MSHTPPPTTHKTKQKHPKKEDEEFFCVRFTASLVPGGAPWLLLAGKRALVRCVDLGREAAVVASSVAFVLCCVCCCVCVC